MYRSNAIKQGHLGPEASRQLTLKISMVVCEYVNAGSPVNVNCYSGSYDRELTSLLRIISKLSRRD